ncbi:hypothetical protein ACWDTD_19720 [Gordonia sp. NPDC003425]
MPTICLLILAATLCLAFGLFGQPSLDYGERSQLLARERRNRLRNSAVDAAAH